jgi:hypothetical protein
MRALLTLISSIGNVYKKDETTVELSCNLGYVADDVRMFLANGLDEHGVRIPFQSLP